MLASRFAPTEAAGGVSLVIPSFIAAAFRKPGPGRLPVGGPAHAASMDLSSYQTDGFWDELLDPGLRPRPGTEQIVRRLAEFTHEELAERQRAADKTLLTMGITFNVYGHEAGTEKVWPFDIVPRVIEAAEWQVVERGLKQRIQALNLFIDASVTIRRLL